MPRRRPGKKLLKSLLPIILVLVVAVIIAVASIVYGITRPPRRPYLVTPQSFAQISGLALKVTDETWLNRDGTQARGWLLRGAEGAPAVILLHKYGADRSWLFNLGIKLNETTNYTILWPDLRAHGLSPPVGSSTFGARESDDLMAALDFLSTLKGFARDQLVGENVGVYGVELGGYAALRAATQDARIQALVLDSLPRSPDEIINAAVRDDVGVVNEIILSAARRATHLYFLGKLDNKSSCELASGLAPKATLVIAGADAGYLRESTIEVARCFQNPSLEVRTDLPLSGFNLTSATGEQGERYDRPVIDFFLKNLN